MFRDFVMQTPFTTKAANLYFQNIEGDNFELGDCSFVATLRALLAQRMSPEESIRLVFGRTCLPSDYIGSNSARAVFGDICDSVLIRSRGRLIIHSLDCDKASNMACFGIINAVFAGEFVGYQKLDKVTAFYRRKFYVDCYVNPKLKSAVVFVDRIDISKMHELQISIPVILSWYFDQKNSLTEEEMELIHALRETAPEKYNKCLAKMASKYDFRSAYIRKLLCGFETRYEKEERDRVLGEISSIDNEIVNLNHTIGARLKKREEECIRLAGLEAKIASDESGNSEIMEYFIRNKSLVLDSVSDIAIRFCVKGYLEYFDSDMAERIISNSSSFLYASLLSSRTYSRENIKRLMEEIFVSDTPRLRIRVCAAYCFMIRGNISPISGYDFGPDFDGCVPNPHINDYSCMGGYSQVVNELLQRRDYIGVFEQCVASCKSLNWSDYTVMRRFVYHVFYDNCLPRCIETPDGEILNTKEAIEWLGKQGQ